ncbi:MAG: GNAT family N-acetyltransferase, partial [Defluviitaleaceae bacterium]|nr:GNAT family N-acetyltransferase [Defluviitaleaceae bacterium]
MVTTERLILRRFTESDEQEYANIVANPNVYRYLGTGSPIASDGAKRMIDHFESVWGYGLGVYAVVEKSSGKLMGHCGIRGLPCGRREILYAFGEEFWGKGYATEAVKTVLQEHNCRPLIGVSYPENAGSMRVMEKSGF